VQAVTNHQGLSTEDLEDKRAALEQNLQKLQKLQKLQTWQHPVPTGETRLQITEPSRVAKLTDIQTDFSQDLQHQNRKKSHSRSRKVRRRKSDFTRERNLKHREREESDDAYVYVDDTFLFQTPDEFDREYDRYRDDRNQQREMDALYGLYEISH
jgi:hypothetical protein